MAAWARHMTASWQTRTIPDPLRTDRPVTSCTEHGPPCHTGQTSNKRHWSEGARNRLSRAARGAPMSPRAQLRGRDQRLDRAMDPPSLRLDAGLVEWIRDTRDRSRSSRNRFGNGLDAVTPLQTAPQQATPHVTSPASAP
jgi:hypothetical protein